MIGILNLITSRLNNIDNLDLSNPLVALDLLVAIFLIIGALVYISRFPVFRVVLGTLFLFGCSLVFLFGGFLLTALVFGVVANLILISLPLIFAPEIRHYLEKLGRFSFLKVFQTKQENEQFIRNVIESVFELAEKKIGALIVIARHTGLGETIESGVTIDAKFGSKILQSIFFPKSILHDGAVVIKDDRILAAGCLLPIHNEVKLDSPFGTRHKSGLSITQDTDAVVIIVSEQRGEVSLAQNSKLEVNLDRILLSERLQKLL